MTTWCNRPITEPILLAPHRSAHVELGPDGICLTGPPGYGERVGHSGMNVSASWRRHAAHRERRYDTTYRLVRRGRAGRPLSREDLQLLAEAAW